MKGLDKGLDLRCQNCGSLHTYFKKSVSVRICRKCGHERSV